MCSTGIYKLLSIESDSYLISIQSQVYTVKEIQNTITILRYDSHLEWWLTFSKLLLVRLHLQKQAIYFIYGSIWPYSQAIFAVFYLIYIGRSLKWWLHWLDLQCDLYRDGSRGGARPEDKATGHYSFQSEILACVRWVWGKYRNIAI